MNMIKSIIDFNEKKDSSIWIRGMDYLRLRWSRRFLWIRADWLKRQTGVLEYNDENSLSCTISLAFYFAREYYTVIRELPTGKGFADICFIPRKMYADKPAVVVELKWDKSARGALEQIKDREYVEALKEYKGNLLLAGINYDRKTKTHTCVIEKFQKVWVISIGLRKKRRGSGVMPDPL